jgi:methionyl aminopeptidase
MTTTDTAAPHEGLAANAPCWCGSGRKYKRCHRLADIDPVVGAAGDAPPFPPRGQRVRPGVQSPRRAVPDSIVRPPYAAGAGMPDTRDPGLPRDADTIARMRVAGKAAAQVLALAGAAVAPGVTTDEIDRVVHEATIALGGYPSPLGYGTPPYPKSCCTSINEVICHGIPDSTELVAGDIVNIDVTVFLDGVHGDTNATFFVGGEEAVDLQSRQLVHVTREALDRAIDAVRPGARVRDLGRAIQPYVESNGLSVVRAFVGHGVGPIFHGDPSVMHYDDPRATRLLEPGMTFTIEPMVNVGSWRHKMWPDEWTAVTSDGKRSAQFEHSLLVTDDGVEVLTAL